MSQRICVSRTIECILELSSDKSRMVEEKRIRDELPANMPLAAKVQQAKQRTANLPNEKFERSKPVSNDLFYIRAMLTSRTHSNCNPFKMPTF